MILLHIGLEALPQNKAVITLFYVDTIHLLCSLLLKQLELKSNEA